MDKVAELIKAGKIKEIADMRDETDLSGLKLAIDLKRGVEPEKLMQKLFRLTPLQDSFPCNFNILIAGMPRVMGIGEILEEWTAWRTDCVKRRIFYQVQKKEDRLHLLKGLERILLDIDKAIRIIRETELENEVIPNLMIGFGIDEIQANYVAEIKLRNINKEYILKQTKAISELEKEIAELNATLKSHAKLQKLIIAELKQVSEKFGQPRKTEIIYEVAQAEPEDEIEQIPDYPVTLFVSKEGYLKKITAQSLRMSGEQKFKEGDSLSFSVETTNRAEILVFTDKFQCYKSRLSDFEDGKASQLGDYLPQKLGMEQGETVLQVLLPGDYKGFVLFFFENGKVAKVPLSAYETKTNRKKLTGAYCEKSPLKTAMALQTDEQVAVYSTDGRAVIFSTAQLLPKTTRNTQGVGVMSVKKKAAVSHAVKAADSGIANPSRYRTRTLPSAGAILKPEDAPEKQISFEV
jgi:DNA gyrase subunit A